MDQYFHMMLVESEEKPYLVEIGSDVFPQPGDMVEFQEGNIIRTGIVIQVASMKRGSDEYAIMMLLKEPLPATKFWPLRWAEECDNEN